MSSVSVVIPCYNYGRYLRGCVESVLSQSGVDVRVLIIDDCSADNSAEVGGQLATEDSRVAFRRHSVNRGHIDTYNEGLLEWADGDYSLLLSADDLLAPGALGRAASFFAEHPKVGMVCGREIRFINNESLSRAEAPASQYEAHIIPGRDLLKLICRQLKNPVSTPTAIVRTELQRRVGGYRPELPHTGDMEMWMRCAAYGDIGFLDVLQAFYRVHGNNMSSSLFGHRRPVDDFHQRQKAFALFFAEHGHVIDRVEELKALCDASLDQMAPQYAEGAFWAASRAFDQGNTQECQSLLEDAAALHPQLTESAQWRRLRIKRMMGVRLWTLVLTVLNTNKRRTDNDGDRIHHTILSMTPSVLRDQTRNCERAHQVFAAGK